MARQSKEKAAAYSRQYYWDHKDEISAKRKERREANPEVSRAYREKNREKINAHSREVYHANIEKEHERRHAYYESHKKESADYQKAKRELDPIRERAKRRAIQLKYRNIHPDRVKAFCKAWHDANKDKDRAWIENNRDKIRARDQLRRAREKSSAPSERILPSEIYERDGWVCQLCHKKVNSRLKWPNPFSPSLDHIMPLAKGGAHSRENVHLAHLRCNISAGVGGVKQLILC